MPILVTGATGFAGGYLLEALLDGERAELIGVSRSGTWPTELAHLSGRLALRACDLCNPGAIESVLRETQPERIYHLAGYAAPSRSFDEPDVAWTGNLTATRSLYDAVVRWGGRPRILFVGSGLVYGDGVGHLPVQDEDTPFRPTSPYATSKAASDVLSYQYARASGLDIIRARPFNHFGPRQSPTYAVPHFAQQLVAISRGEQPPVLEVGNLDARRDLSDVRDVAAAYVLLMKSGQPGEAYNIASGGSCAIGQALARLIALSGLRVEIRQNPALVRAGDPAVPQVDISKLRRTTGWAPKYTLEQTLADTLEYWRRRAEQP